MLQKSDIDTLDKARAFLLLFTHGACQDDQPLAGLCRPPRLHAPVYGAYLLVSNIVTPALLFDYNLEFRGCPADLTLEKFPSANGWSQAGLLLRSVPAAGCGRTGVPEGKHADQYYALLYAPMLMHDKAYMDDLWSAYEDACKADGLSYGLGDLQKYVDSLLRVSLPLC